MIRGAVFDVAVDLRSDSKTFGKWFGVELTAENKKKPIRPEDHKVNQHRNNRLNKHPHNAKIRPDKALAKICLPQIEYI